MARLNAKKRAASATSDRFSNTRSPTAVDHEAIKDALARELISVCLTALKSYGLSSERLAALTAKVAAQSRQKLCYAAELLTEAQRLAETIHKWGEDPAYLDGSGCPLVLRIRGGSRSFSSLAKKFFSGRDILEIVGLGCEANVLERVGTDKVARLNNVVLFTGNSILQLAHSVRTVRCFLNTAEFNRRVKTNAISGRPDRAAHVEVTEKDFAEFERIIRPQISGLIEMSNRWLTGRNARTRQHSGPRAQKKRVAGIQAFVFKE